MTPALRTAASVSVAAAIGGAATVQFALQRYACTAADGAEFVLYGTVLPFRTEFDPTGAGDIPTLWLAPFLLNAAALAVLAWLLVARGFARRDASQMSLVGQLVPFAMAAFIGWFMVLGLGGYDIRQAGFGPDRSTATCSTSWGFYPGAASSYNR